MKMARRKKASLLIRSLGTLEKEWLCISHGAFDTMGGSTEVWLLLGTIGFVSPPDDMLLL
jgi:hypothetical protein